MRIFATLLAASLLLAATPLRPGLARHRALDSNAIVVRIDGKEQAVTPGRWKPARAS